jgi:hypothetical protein
LNWLKSDGSSLKKREGNSGCLFDKILGERCLNQKEEKMMDKQAEVFEYILLWTEQSLG